MICESGDSHLETYFFTAAPVVSCCAVPEALTFMAPQRTLLAALTVQVEPCSNMFQQLGAKGS